jgi:hypothetical protein
MSKPTMKGKAQALLTLVQQLAQMPGLTWVEANNAVYSPGGPFARLFPTKADRKNQGKRADRRPDHQPAGTAGSPLAKR